MFTIFELTIKLHNIENNLLVNFFFVKISLYIFNLGLLETKSNSLLEISIV